MYELNTRSTARARARRTRTAYRVVAPAVAPVTSAFERTFTGGAGDHFRHAVRILPHGLVLDIGTGAGRQLRGLPEDRLGDAVGLDVVETLLRRMTRRFPTARAVLGDAHHLPFRPGAFDAAIGGWVWETLVDRGTAAEELHLGLRPGADLLLVACTRPSGRIRLAARLLDLAFVRLLGATIEEAELTQLPGFAVVELRRFTGGLFTFVRLRRVPTRRSLISTRTVMP